jgi:3-isopropylmalate dehydrogenase
MKLQITVLPGDGIGPEVTKEAVRVLHSVADVCGYQFSFSECPIGGAAVVAAGSPLPEETLAACLDCDAVLLGAVGGPAFDRLEPALRPEAGLLRLRQELGCFANLRPAVASEVLADCSPLRPEVRKGADVLIVRELLGGLYFGQPRGINLTEAFNTMRYSEAEVERIARIAFQEARNRRKKVTSVDKANVLETSRLWRAVVTRVSQQYKDVTLEHAYVDSFAMQLITTPTRYDVVLTENLFGDILSDEAAVISGSLGLLASASIGGKVGLYEPIHGSAPDIAGKSAANPIGAITSAGMLLRYSAKLMAEADGIDEAVSKVIAEGYRTADLIQDPTERKHAHTTTQVGARVAESVTETLNQRIAYHAV